MRLTNEIRRAFVAGVMRDVPQVDYTEQIRKVVMDDAVAALPSAVADLWARIDLRQYVNTHCGTFGRVSVNYPAAIPRSLSPKAAALVQSLEQRAKEQRDRRNELEDRLHRVALGLSTRKQLAEALPEFAKYLPADQAKACRTLPTVTGTVEAFKAAGWPGR